ncbi:hypothetical protein FSP39_018502 [Pinctada imbricata]|uniref:Carboxylesterase type B domain-containing protein n=1 Tax=Pinctada imbricata TaxID=66713 RepID=A0AA88Y5M1_PINIB|nr:hypothetical protein FSP39_018502 [Pinctada imbricata]
MTGREGKDISILMGETLGCHYRRGSPSEISKFMQCMRKASAHTIVSYTYDAVKAPTIDVIQNIPLAPVIDGELFLESPSKLLSNPDSEAYKFFKSLDIIVGNCNSEGSLLLLNIPRFQKRYDFDLNKGVPQDIFCGKIAKSFADVYFNGDESIKDAVCKEYGRTDEAEQARQLVDMYTDFFFLVPSVNTLNYHAGNQTNHSTYQYIFTQRSPVPFGPNRPPWYVGSGHASELTYLFGIRDLPKNITVTKEDLTLSDKMIAYWTNFAKNG